MAGKGIKIPLNIPGLRQAKEDLKELNKQFEAAKKRGDDQATKKLAKEYNDLSKAIDKTTGELLEMNKAGQLVGTKFDDLNEVLFDTQQEILPLTSQIGEMEDRMYQLAAAGDTTSDEFKALQGETVRLRKVIRDTDKGVDLLAENQGLSVFAEGWSQVGQSILSLNFEQAALDADRLKGSVGNLGKIGANSIKALTKTVGTLAKTFIQFGLALLTNPLFLLIAAITAIIAAVIWLANKLGLLTAIFDAMSAVLDGVIAGFKALTDWIGITDYAGEEAARNEAKRVAESLENIRKKREALTESYNSEQKAIDRQIKLRKIEGKDFDDLTEKKIQGTIDYKKEMMLSFQEELKALQSLNLERQKSLILVAANKAQIEQINQQLKALDDEVLDAQVELAENERTQMDSRREAWAKYKEERLNALRLIQDLEIELLGEGTEREIAAMNLKYDRLIEDTLASETLIQEEKEKIAKYYESLRAVEEGKILQKQIDEQAKKDAKLAELRDKANNEFLAEEEELSEIIRQAKLSETQLEIEAIEDKYFNLIERARQHGLDTIELEKQKNAELAAIDKKRTDEQLANEKAVQDAKFQLANDALSLVSAATELFGKKNEKNAKRAFEVNKAAQIAQAVISTYQGANAIFASAAANPASVLFPAQPFLTAGIAVANGLVNVAKIAQTKFEGGNTPSAGGASAPSIGGGASVSSSTPSFNLFGQGNNLDEAKSAESKDLTQQIQVKAVVSETEVTNTQQKVNNIKQSAEL